VKYNLNPTREYIEFFYTSERTFIIEMQLEVALAVRRVRRFYDYDLRAPNGLEFEKCLFDKLVKKFLKHWYPKNPMRGNGYRSLWWHKNCDSVITEVATMTHFEIPDCRVPWCTIIWIDPGSVTCRIGDNGTIFEIEDASLLSAIESPMSSACSSPCKSPLPETTPTKAFAMASCMLTPPRSPTMEFESVIIKSFGVENSRYEMPPSPPSSTTSSLSRNGSFQLDDSQAFGLRLSSPPPTQPPVCDVTQSNSRYCRDTLWNTNHYGESNIIRSAC